MKHNTHIYLASKAIQFTPRSVQNMRTAGGSYLRGSSKGSETNAAKERQRLLEYYQHQITEASWAPDDVLKDMAVNHIFKLFTLTEFPGFDASGLKHVSDGNRRYYVWGGGLPYRVDHVARSVSDMHKLRAHNDQFEMKQIMYKYLLLSHYVVDAHVPVHCDLRDDPPKAGSMTDKPTDLSRYLSDKQGDTPHKNLEKLWDDAVMPVAIRDKHVLYIEGDEATPETAYSPSVRFALSDCDKGGIISPTIIPKNGLMNFMIQVCIRAHQRSVKIFPVNDPTNRNDAVLPTITREIFAETIADLISVWRYIWVMSQS